MSDAYFRAMGEHIRDIGQLTPSDVHRLQQLRRLNRNLDGVKRQLARAAGLNLRDLETVLTECAKVDGRMAAKILGVPDAAVSIRNNEPLRRALRAQYAQTAGRLANLSNTTVDSGAYRDAVDAAVTAVTSGAEDYGSAIRRTLRQAGALGLRVRDNGTQAVEYASGHTRRVDTAVRMNILDAMRQLNQQVRMEVGEQFGADGVEIDAHMLCAEDHLPYQGQQYSKEEFEQIQDSLERPFGEWNCRHTWAPIILGVSPRAYTDEDLARFERYSTEEVEIDGVSHTRYEWSQVMRAMETRIRAEKDTATLARYAGDDVLRRECQGRIVGMMDQYERVSDAAGLGPEYRRTYVGGFKDAKDKAAMARGYAIGQWPAAGGKISRDAYDDLRSFARENGVILHGFEAFNGDTELIREFITDMRGAVAKMNADHLFTHKRLHLMTDYTMAPEDYAITHNTTITINPAAFRDREALKSDYAERANAGWFVRGTDYHSIARHEMGHVIIHALGLSPRQISEIVSGIDSLSISEYASMTDGETIAESFSAYISGVGSELSLTVIERCATIISSRGGER